MTLLAEFKNFEDERMIFEGGARRNYTAPATATIEFDDKTTKCDKSHPRANADGRASPNPKAVHAAEIIRKAEARAAEAENENLVQQLFDISNRVKELNKILAEKDAAVDQLRREHDTAESKKAEENDEL